MTVVTPIRPIRLAVVIVAGLLAVVLSLIGWADAMPVALRVLLVALGLAGFTAAVSWARRGVDSDGG